MSETARDKVVELDEAAKRMAEAWAEGDARAAQGHARLAGNRWELLTGKVLTDPGGRLQILQKFVEVEFPHLCAYCGSRFSSLWQLDTHDCVEYLR